MADMSVAWILRIEVFALEIGATTLVAEGVETPEELDALRSLGVDAAQGYLIGRPTSAPDEWLLWSAASAPATFG